ncbi:MAG: ornithine carbamoyltransferase, partial [Candidatus Delongbacteria bacterium]|nr:ornithine carbamoyltransferase [Candidatus Delongbacteria bacterium]
MKRDFLEVTDFSAAEIKATLTLAAEVKQQTRAGACPKPLSGKTIALIFHKASLRTRISFEVGVDQLGGNTIYVTDSEIQLGKRESIYDVAKVMSRFVDGIFIRTFGHDDVRQLAEHATVPVINMLTDLTHPCQIFSDLFTIYEHKPEYENLKISYFGDGNNITNSLLNLATLVPMRLFIATHATTRPDEEILKKAQASSLSEVVITDDPVEAARDADVLYADVWASMGEKDQLDTKIKLLQKFQLNEELVAH